MSNYLLSICIPTYNGAKTIKNMLNILLPQVNDNVEIIISDNCSTDETPNIIKGYQSIYNIKYIRNEVNIGPDANFLQCMNLASGKFTYLLSDDDILVEGALEKILNYLNKYPDVSLVYLDSVGFSQKYIDVSNCHYYPEHVKKVDKDLYTTNRIEFMNYAIRMWGFLSSFLWNTEKYKKIKNAEQYFGTYWLQSYIHILCVSNKDDYLGVIKGPIMAAGEYMGINNFSCDLVDGVYYKKMIDLAINNSYFDKKQLYSFYIWRLCFLGRLAVIKEKEIKIKKTSKKKLFKLTWKYPYAWLRLFPYFFVPRWFILLRKKLLNRQSNDVVKRA